MRREAAAPCFFRPQTVLMDAALHVRSPTVLAVGMRPRAVGRRSGGATSLARACGGSTGLSAGHGRSP
eukprot:7419245-Lingulodinium_polyedra.AAC.1